MKKILITGANSYIGTSFEQWLKQWPNHYMVDAVDMKDSTWKEKDFSGYDAVFHVAGIAHADTRKATKEAQDLYYRVNRDLAIETARKVKKDGVKQFIFMSSIIVYGDSRSIKSKRMITKDTIPTPSNFYGDSKLQAEKGISSLQLENFNVVVIRSPMIYGKGSKGNYHKLAKYAKKSAIFPNIKNERSMLHIDNLCEFIRLIIDNEECGIFYPQNDEYICTSEMVKMIAEVNGNKLKLTKIFNLFLVLIPKSVLYKVFGSIVYEKDMSKYKINYNVHSFYDSIRLTERQ